MKTRSSIVELVVSLLVVGQTYAQEAGSSESPSSLPDMMMNRMFLAMVGIIVVVGIIRIVKRTMGG